ncbi:sugar phosphate isomerase/epimerase family protein [Halosimplex amylolyticum]|uniref:sugar phosphate isomerase/epimerase family protein n=1 Tax=Halosimplex amylolyticum TaxID=3396616 RepID=UPI003F57E17E
MKFGLCTISSKDRPVEEVIGLAADAGYDGVEVWGRDHVGDGSTETCEGIAAAAADRGLEIAAYGSYLRCGDDDVEDVLEHELAVADRLGAATVRVWAGRQEYGDHDPDHWDAVVADLERVTERAGDRGLSVTVEKHANTLTNDREGARRLIEAIDDERCGLNYQPGFSIPAAEIEREAETLAPLSNQLHLQGTRERTGKDRAPLSAVYYDLAAVLDPFLDRGFDGYANVEFVTDERPYREAIEDDLSHLRSLVA